MTKLNRLCLYLILANSSPFATAGDAIPFAMKTETQQEKIAELLGVRQVSVECKAKSRLLP